MRLPPLLASDFVIHYRDTDFHVHKFVLLHHAGYFRNHLSATAPAGKVEKDEVVGEGGKRRRVTTFSSEEVSSECQHPAYVLCLHLPHDFGDGRLVTEDEFLLFLRHLYFASILRLPPFMPNPVLLASLSDDSPTSLTYPADRLIREPALWEYVSNEDPNAQWYSAELLSLFHYFDCQQAMRRSEQVILRASLEDRDTCHTAWFWLPLAVRYRMKAVEVACMEQIAGDEGVGRRVDDEEFLDILRQLPVAVIARVMAGMCKRRR